LSAPVRIRAALCLAMALANSGPANADSRVYRWLDGEGKVHITATPPPEGARPAPEPARPAAPRERVQVVPETGSTAAPQPAAPAAEPDAESCAKHEKEISAWLAARRKVAQVEAKIARIEENPVQASSTEHCPAFGFCTTESFVRDEALRRATDELAQAEDQAGEAEENAHQAGTPDRCLIDPSE
jgi:hypothetical protein